MPERSGRDKRTSMGTSSRDAGSCSRPVEAPLRPIWTVRVTSAAEIPCSAALSRSTFMSYFFWESSTYQSTSTTPGRPPSSNKVVEYRLWTILDALGIPRCGLHAFRHSHTALLLDSGATPKVVQRQLRHADARTTLEIYGHLVGDAHRDAVENVASILDCNGPKPSVGDKWV